MAKYEKSITEEVKKNIIALFYRTELYVNEKIIDNTDSTIAKSFGLKTGTVGAIISEHLRIKVENLNKKINDNGKI